MIDYNSDYIKNRCIKVYKEGKSAAMLETKQTALNWLDQAAKLAKLWKNAELESMALSFAKSLRELIYSKNIENAWNQELDPDGGILNVTSC